MARMQVVAVLSPTPEAFAEWCAANRYTLDRAGDEAVQGENRRAVRVGGVAELVGPFDGIGYAPGFWHAGGDTAVELDVLARTKLRVPGT